jgi:hypothetical protein
MNGTESNSHHEKVAPRITGASLVQVPGVIAVSLYLVLLAVVIVIGVIEGVLGGSHYPPFYLFFTVLLLTASGGLVLLFRWAWALALAAVFLLASYDLWIFTTQHQDTVLLQGILNLIFFLYLVRPEVREKLR